MSTRLDHCRLDLAHSERIGPIERAAIGRDEGAASVDVLIGVGGRSTAPIKLDRGPLNLWHDVGAGSIFEDLPEWEFTVREDSAGGYRVIAVRDGGLRGEGTGQYPDGLLDDYRSWARTIESDLGERKLK